MQIAGHTLSATTSASRSSNVAKPSASQAAVSFDTLWKEQSQTFTAPRCQDPSNSGAGWRDGSRHAVHGNAGALISFRVGAEDAPIVIQELYERFGKTDLLQLPNYSISSS
jgi:hypothetical protein